MLLLLLLLLLLPLLMLLVLLVLLLLLVPSILIQTTPIKLAKENFVLSELSQK